jgi:hypothetical protein
LTTLILVDNQLDAKFFYNTFIYLNPINVLATLCSSSGGQSYEYNFWYDHSVLVAVRYAGQDGTSRWKEDNCMNTTSGIMTMW